MTRRHRYTRGIGVGGGWINMGHGSSGQVCRATPQEICLSPIPSESASWPSSLDGKTQKRSVGGDGLGWKFLSEKILTFLLVNGAWVITTFHNKPHLFSEYTCTYTVLYMQRLKRYLSMNPHLCTLRVFCNFPMMDGSSTQNSKSEGFVQQFILSSSPAFLFLCHT